MDAEGYDIYIDRETGETIKIDFIFESHLDFYQDNPERYMFLERRIENYIENDDWHSAKDFVSEEITLLIECDYCEKRYTSSLGRRRRVESAFRVSSNMAGLHIPKGEPDLYKDNCKKCQETKKRESTLLRHGFENPFEQEDVKIRRAKSFQLHNDVKTSRGQRYLAKMFNGELNARIRWYFADILLDNKIVIEYDGGGHNLSVLLGSIAQKEFDENEAKRDEYFFSKGYKVLRFDSRQELFPDEKITKHIISEAIADLILSESNTLTIQMSTRTNDPVYGKLKPIKDILESSEWGEELL